MTKQVYSMKQSKIRTAFPLVALATLVASLAGCGGGGDDAAGSVTAFSVQPTTNTITANTAVNGGPPAGLCSAAYAGEYFIYGGAAPYRIDNTAPGYMVTDKTSVDARGGSFKVTFTGGCITGGLIVIVDKLDNQVIVTLNNKPAGATTP